jgi:hypothetical protein
MAMRRAKSTAKLNLVVRLSDGTRRKGVTNAFEPAKATLHLKEIDVGGNLVEIHDLDMQSVQAAFFVRDLAILRTSRQTNRDSPVTPPGLNPDGKMLRVTFSWGEMMDGMSYDYEPRENHFFLYPMGPLNRAYNIEKVYVTRKATARVEVLAG